MTIKVKPLVWEDRGDYVTCFPRYKAETVLGVYYIDRDKSGLFNVWSSATRGKVQVRTLEAAKAAAQADYEARILSAIEAVDPATIRAEALRSVMDRIDATRKIVAAGAETGFNCLDGDWAERLYQNNAELTAALTDLRAMMEKLK